VGKFEDRFGKKFADMDPGEKELVVFSSLERIEDQLEILNGKTKVIGRLEKLVYAGTLIVPAIIAWLSYVSKTLFGR